MNEKKTLVGGRKGHMRSCSVRKTKEANVKKNISTALAMVLVLSITACGASDTSEDDAPSQKTETIAETVQPQTTVSEQESEDAPSQEIETTAAAVQPQTTAVASEQEKTTTSGQPEVEAVFPEFQKEATITETVLVDENDVRITATGLTYGNYSVELNLRFENNSDKDLRFYSNTLSSSCNSVNGYMIEDGYLNCSVAAGKKANDSISIGYDTLRLYGIFEIADLEIGFDISDDDYNHIYSGPRQITTSAASQHDDQKPCYEEAITSEAAQNYFGYAVPYFSDKVLYDQDGFAVVSSTIMKNDDGEDMLLLEVKNTTEQSVEVTTSDIYLNGLGVYGSIWSSDTINPGKTAIVDLALSDLLDNDFRDVYGVQDTGTVALTMKFKDTDGDDLGSPASITVENPDVESYFSKDGQEIYNANGIRIIMKDVVEDSSEYSDDMYVLLLAENNTDGPVDITDVYDSFSINGYMMDCFMNLVQVKSGASAILEIRLWDSDLEKNDITEISEITQMELEIEIMQDATLIDRAKLIMDFNGGND